MQHETYPTISAAWLVGLALLEFACTSSAPRMRLDEAGAGDQGGIEFFTREPRLYEAALRSMQRIESAIGASGVALADEDTAATCTPSHAGCGFELSSADVVYCFGDPDPALACTSLGGGGRTIGIEMQAELTGEQLDNRLIHELFHVITYSRAPHSLDGLFMEYSVGNERITESTLESVCSFFPCTALVLEESPSVLPAVQP